jgi:NADH-quinone oxidoreductase subunit A
LESEFLGILIIFGLSALIAVSMLGLSSILGPKRPNPVKDEPFECGETPIEPPHGKFAVKFNLIAMLFIIFDVEIVFLFPWAVLFRELRRPSNPGGLADGRSATWWS